MNVIITLFSVPILVDTCPYEVTANWPNVDPGDYGSHAFLAKEAKNIRELMFIYYIGDLILS